MTRKDYEALARAVLAARGAMEDGDEHSPRVTIDEVAHRLADALKLDNAAFDRRRFLLACGVDVGAWTPIAQAEGRRGRVDVVRVKLDDSGC